MKTIIISTIAALGIAGVAAADEAKSPTVMSDTEMHDIVAGNHVIRLVLQQTGKAALPTDAASEATDRAGSIDGAGNDRPSIVRLLD